MLRICDLLDVADDFRRLAGVERETTLSHRLFGDTKRLSALRRGGEITVGRFNLAMAWFADNWPAGQAFPAALDRYVQIQHGAAR